MGEYKFTGPFYSDPEDYGYEHSPVILEEEASRTPSEMTVEELQELKIAGAEDTEAVSKTEVVSEPEAVPEAEVVSEPEAEVVSETEAVSNTGTVPPTGTTSNSGPVPNAGTVPPFGASPNVGGAPNAGARPTGKRKTKRFEDTIIKAVCIALIIGLVGGGTFVAVASVGFHVLGIGNSTQTAAEIQKTTSAPLASGNIKDSIDVSVIAQQCMPSVVSITNRGVQEIRSWFGVYEQEISGSGSGIIIGENNTELLIVTNYHVVADSKELSVYFSFDEKEEEPTVVSAKIKGYDSQKDLAVISVQLSEIPTEAKSQIAIATIGNSSELKVGEQVVAIGNALGYGQSVTTGIVSALNRDVTVEGANGEAITNKLIQTDAAINPGNSGGALINMRGEVIGINSVKFASAEVEGMGYAIPITDVELIIGDLMNKVTRDKVNQREAGYLGIQCVDVSSEVAQMYDLPMGVYVKAVVDGSAAELAGIKSGDVIVKLDGSSVAGNAELKEALSYYRAGETIEVVVRTRDSGYEEQIFQVTLSSATDAGIE